MAEILEDGSGKGYKAKIDLDGRLHVDSVSTQRGEYNSIIGTSYNINTGAITLTNGATDNGVLYVKNNEDYDLIIDTLFYIFGNSTSGTGDMDVTVIRNPTGGTLISGASAVAINQNRNFGSSRTLDITAYKGSTGTTITGGDDILFTILNTGAQRVAVSAGAIVLQKGSSIAVKFKTPTSNTSMRVAFAIACYLELEEDNFE
jgi:hypothetical protein